MCRVNEQIPIYFVFYLQIDNEKVNAEKINVLNIKEKLGNTVDNQKNSSFVRNIFVVCMTVYNRIIFNNVAWYNQKVIVYLVCKSSQFRAVVHRNLKLSGNWKNIHISLEIGLDHYH